MTVLARMFKRPMMQHLLSFACTKILHIFKNEKIMRKFRQGAQMLKKIVCAVSKAFVLMPQRMCYHISALLPERVELDHFERFRAYS